MIVVVYQKGSHGQRDKDLWVGEMDEPTFWRLDGSQAEVQEYLIGKGVEFDTEVPIDLDELIPEVAAEVGLHF